MSSKRGSKVKSLEEYTSAQTLKKKNRKIYQSMMKNSHLLCFFAPSLFCLSL
jgi:hypothetical protein